MGYYNGHNVCTKQKYDRWCGSEYNFMMTEGNKKRFSAGEVTEAIFTDEDSNDENFDCGFIRFTQMMEQIIEWIQRFDSCDTEDGTGNRMDPEVCQVDTDDQTCSRIDPEAHWVDTNDGTGKRIDPEVC